MGMGGRFARNRREPWLTEGNPRQKIKASELGIKFGCGHVDKADDLWMKIGVPSK
jgi:hypothetical protein